MKLFNIQVTILLEKYKKLPLLRDFFRFLNLFGDADAVDGADDAVDTGKTDVRAFAAAPEFSAVIKRYLDTCQSFCACTQTDCVLVECRNRKMRHFCFLKCRNKSIERTIAA